MAKGKKFNAAEKHFEEKCVVWREKIRELEQKNNEYHERIIELSYEIERLQLENDELRQCKETIMGLKDITNEDVRTLIKSKEAVNRLSEIVDAMSHIYSMF